MGSCRVLWGAVGQSLGRVSGHRSGHLRLEMGLDRRTPQMILALPPKDPQNSPHTGSGWLPRKDRSCSVLGHSARNHRQILSSVEDEEFLSFIHEYRLVRGDRAGT